MKNFILLICTIFTLTTIACNISKDTSVNREVRDPSLIENPENYLTLIDHLRKVPGVSVSGSGSNASVTIRGVSSINLSNEPLFVVDGQILSGGLQDAMQSIPVDNIKSIRVLKSAGETGIYGVRGANGVIVIKMK